MHTSDVKSDKVRDLVYTGKDVSAWKVSPCTSGARTERPFIRPHDDYLLDKNKIGGRPRDEMIKTCTYKRSGQS